MTELTPNGDVATIQVRSQLDMQFMLDLADPQPRYKQALEQGGFLRPVDGIVMTCNRELTDYVLRHHELFRRGWT